MLARSPLGIIVAASLAGLLFGFDTAVISGVTQSLRAVFALSPWGLGLAVSAALWAKPDRAERPPWMAGRGTAPGMAPRKWAADS